MEIPTKKCSKCKEYKPRSEFNKHSGNSTGLQSPCRECQNPEMARRSKERYHSDPEYKRRVNEKTRLYREELKKKFFHEIKSQTCRVCGTEKPINEFPLGKDRCFDCGVAHHKEKMRERAIKLREEEERIGVRTCRDCQQEKPLEAFRERKTKGLPRRIQPCLECEKTQVKERRKQNPQLHRERAKASFQRHKEKDPEWAREQYRKHNARTKERAEKDPEYKELLKERDREYHRRWYAKKKAEQLQQEQQDQRKAA